MTPSDVIFLFFLLCLVRTFAIQRIEHSIRRRALCVNPAGKACGHGNSNDNQCNNRN